jgi:deoxyribose-phosphate aldolase
MGVKASGGVRDANDAATLIAAGATRLGASASVAIVSNSSTAAAASSGY